MEKKSLLAENSNEFKDVVLKISEIKKDFFNDFEIQAFGEYMGNNAGLKIIIRNALKPGVSEGKIQPELATKGGIQFKSIGRESDLFISALSSYYELSGEQKFTIRSVVADCLVLSSKIFDINKDKLKLLLTFDPENKKDLLCELYMDIDLFSKEIVLSEKDMQWREKIITNFIR
ncbi:MAG: hypothetical protein JXR58_11920 [Bacteroidales bacterium]|nr:hypothetical protein [Bacteroidales bacterium]